MYMEWSGTGLPYCQQKFASISKKSMKKYRQTWGTSKADVGQNLRGSIFSRQNGVVVTFPAIGRGSSQAIASTIFLAIGFLDSFRFLDPKKSMRFCFSIADRHFFLVGYVYICFKVTQLPA